MICIIILLYYKLSISQNVIFVTQMAFNTPFLSYQTAEALIEIRRIKLESLTNLNSIFHSLTNSIFPADKPGCGLTPLVEVYYSIPIVTVTYSVNTSDLIMENANPSKYGLSLAIWHSNQSSLIFFRNGFTSLI